MPLPRGERFLQVAATQECYIKMAPQPTHKPLPSGLSGVPAWEPTWP